jgi:adenine-specific DNA-methyltransferase
MLILPENKFAVLVSESSFMAFDEQLDAHPEIDTVFIVTDSEKAYREMVSGLRAKHTYQLYRSYLDNFRINARR